MSSLHALDKSKKIDLTCAYKKKLNFKKNVEVTSKGSHLDLNPHNNHPRNDINTHLHHAVPKRGDRTVGEYWEKNTGMISSRKKK